MPLIPNNVLD